VVIFPRQSYFDENDHFYAPKSAYQCRNHPHCQTLPKIPILLGRVSAPSNLSHPYSAKATLDSRPSWYLCQVTAFCRIFVVGLECPIFQLFYLEPSCTSAATEGTFRLAFVDLTVTDTHFLPTNKQVAAATRQASRISLFQRIITYPLAKFLAPWFWSNHPVIRIGASLDQIRLGLILRSISKAPAKFKYLTASIWNLVKFKGFALSIELLRLSFHALVAPHAIQVIWSGTLEFFQAPLIVVINHFKAIFIQ